MRKEPDCDCDKRNTFVVLGLVSLSVAIVRRRGVA